MKKRRNLNHKMKIYEVRFTNKFNEDIKYYIKKKRFLNIKKDIGPIIEDLESGILHGVVISDLKLSGKDSVYKVRVANSNTNMGKSNGYRMIYYLQEEFKVIFVMSIYYKKDDGNVLTDKEIVSLIKNILE